MRLRKLIQKRIDRQAGGLRVSGAVNAAISVNVDEPAATDDRVVSHQRARSRQVKTQDKEASDDR
jgi:hypothetical protein